MIRHITTEGIQSFLEDFTLCGEFFPEGEQRNKKTWSVLGVLPQCIWQKTSLCCFARLCNH